MTKEQIDILIKDGDIIPIEVECVFSYDEVNESVKKLNENKILIGKNFNISDSLDEVINFIYNFYLDFLVSQFHEFFIENIIAINIKELGKNQQKRFFEEKVQQQIKAKDDLGVHYRFYGSSKTIHQSWKTILYKKLDIIIECIKFEVFKGSEIENLNTEKNIDEIIMLRKYFISGSTLDEIVKAYTIERNLIFLQEKIREIENSEPVLNHKNKIEKAAIAMLIFYRGIVRAETENYVEKILIELNFSINKTYVKKVRDLCSDFYNDESILKTGGNTNTKDARKRQIKSIIPFLKGYPKGLSKAEEHLQLLN